MNYLQYSQINIQHSIVLLYVTLKHLTITVNGVNRPFQSTFLISKDI
jgi:hypothetical protein